MVRINKKGWIRIVEAVIAIMLLAGFLSFMLISQNKKVDFSEYATNIESSLVRDIAKNDSLRVEILGGNIDSINRYIESRIPANFNFSSRICSLEEACGCLNCPLDRDVYADSSPVFSSLEQYSPKQFKLFIWKK